MSDPENQQTKSVWRQILTCLPRIEPITAFTLMLVIVGFLQWHTLEKTDETLKIQQRAWLSTMQAVLYRTPEKDGSIAFGISFGNSGREPAAGVKIQIKNSTIDSYDGRFANLSDIVVPKNDTCDGLMPDRGRFVIPPTGTGLTFNVAANSIHGDPRMVVDDKILKGEKFYVARGCAAYLTQEKIRHTSFCYILYSEIPAPAPGQPPPARTFQFVNCSTGFDAT